MCLLLAGDSTRGHLPEHLPDASWWHSWNPAGHLAGGDLPGPQMDHVHFPHHQWSGHLHVRPDRQWNSGACVGERFLERWSCHPHLLFFFFLFEGGSGGGNAGPFLIPVLCVLAQLLVFSVLMSFFSMLAYSAQYTITPELYPTSMRTMGVGACSCLNRSAAILSPLLSGGLVELSDSGLFVHPLYLLLCFGRHLSQAQLVAHGSPPTAHNPPNDHCAHTQWPPH